MHAGAVLCVAIGGGKGGRRSFELLNRKGERTKLRFYRPRSNDMAQPPTCHRTSPPRGPDMAAAAAVITKLTAQPNQWERVRATSSGRQRV